MWPRRLRTECCTAGQHCNIPVTPVQGTTMLVTSGSDGLLVVWNTDSGAISQVLTPQGFEDAPLSDRPVEQVGQCVPGEVPLKRSAVLHRLPGFRQPPPAEL